MLLSIQANHRKIVSQKILQEIWINVRDSELRKKVALKLTSMVETLEEVIVDL